MDAVVLGIIATTFVILLLVLGLLSIFFRAGQQRSRQEKILAETKLAFEREVRQVESEIKEQTLQHLAQELHDNIGQLLTFVNIRLENYKLDYPQTAEGLQSAQKTLGEATQQLRMLSRTLNSNFLHRISLSEAVATEVKRIEGLRRFEVHYEESGEESGLIKDQELMVFRVFQEITQNALRHSGAKNMYIKLESSETEFMMEIKDDGKGFDKEELWTSGKISGLNNIVKRVELAGLHCIIDSEKGKGTYFIIKKASAE